MLGVYAWLTAALIFLISEMGHPGFFYWLSFALGSLVAAGLSWYDFSWQTELIGFLVGSLVAIALLKATIGRLLARHDGHHTKTNSDALVGKTGLVVEAITIDQPGRVKIGGEIWLARTEKEAIAQGVRVQVRAVRGSHVLVSPVE